MSNLQMVMLMNLAIITILWFVPESMGQGEVVFTRVPGKILNKKYVICYNTTTWLGAHYYCNTNSYELGTIESTEETQFLLNYFEGVLGLNTTGPDLWLSGSTLGSKTPYVPESLRWSTTGAKVNYTNWGTRQEPDSVYQPFNFAKCISASYNYVPGASGNRDVNWRIKDCTEAYGFMCQHVH